MKVNVIGDSLIDISFGLPKQFIHRYQQAEKIELPFGDKLSTEGYTITPGGSGANVSIGLKKAGFDVRFCTGISDDIFGKFLLKTLKDKDIVVEEISVEGQTPLSVILRVGGERTIVTARQSGSRLPTEMPEQSWIHLGPLHGSLDQFASQLLAHQVKSGQELSINPSIDSIEERSRGLLSLLKTTKILVVNLREALQLARLPFRTEIMEILRSLHRLGPEIVCVTDGEKGAYVAWSQLYLHVPALMDRSERLDATGAGDAFMTGFLTGYLIFRDELEQPELLERSATFGIANSAAVLSEIGAQAGLLNLEELKDVSRRVKIKEIG